MSIERHPKEPRSRTVALDHFLAHGGMLRTREALEAGIHPGLYTLSAIPVGSHCFAGGCTWKLPTSAVSAPKTR